MTQVATLLSKLLASTRSQRPRTLLRTGSPLAGLLLCGVLAACGGDSGSGPSDAKAEQNNGGCPAAPQSLTGTKAAGATCTTAAECTPICCACSGSTKKWLGGACVNGKCADSTATCTQTTNDALYCK